MGSGFPPGPTPLLGLAQRERERRPWAGLLTVLKLKGGREREAEGLRPEEEEGHGRVVRKMGLRAKTKKGRVFLISFPFLSFHDHFKLLQKQFEFILIFFKTIASQ